MVKKTGLVPSRLKFCTPLKRVSLKPANHCLVSDFLRIKVLIIEFYLLVFNCLIVLIIWGFFSQLISLLPLVLLTRHHVFSAVYWQPTQKGQHKVWFHITLYPIQLSIVSERGDLTFSHVSHAGHPANLKEKNINIYLLTHTLTHTLIRFIQSEDLIWRRGWE